MTGFKGLWKTYQILRDKDDFQIFTLADMKAEFYGRGFTNPDIEGEVFLSELFKDQDGAGMEAVSAGNPLGLSWDGGDLGEYD